MLGSGYITHRRVITATAGRGRPLVCPRMKNKGGFRLDAPGRCGSKIR